MSNPSDTSSAPVATGASNTRAQVAFSVVPTIDGYEVVADDTGRPVLARDTRQQANGAAQRLNSIVRSGDAGALVKALSTSGSSVRRRGDSQGYDEGLGNHWYD